MKRVTIIKFNLAGLLCAALLLVPFGCQPTQQPTQKSVNATREVDDAVSNAAKRRALTARDALFQRLVGRLFQTIASGGPTAAIEVCSREAQQIAQTVADEYGVEIGRTSFKLRNPANQPPAWAASLIEQRQQEPTFVNLSDGGTGALLPIKLKSNCLTCHGEPEQIPADVKAKLDELYPNDQATGFKEGDLRGWFWVVVPSK